MSATFKRLLLNMFGIDAEEYVSAFPSCFHACEALLNEPKNWKGKVNIVPFQRLKFLLLLESKGVPANPKMIDASLFELEIICKRSPFYAFVAFNVPFDECERMASALGVVQREDVFAYQQVYRMVLEGRKVSFKEAHEHLLTLGVQVDTLPPLFTVQPFGNGVLAKHPLRDIDPSVTSPAECATKIGNPSQVVTKIRERNCLQNKLVCFDEAYMLKAPMTEFVGFVRSLLT